MTNNCEKDMKRQVLNKSIEPTMNSLSGFFAALIATAAHARR
jgi:hypothetical protein